MKTQLYYTAPPDSHFKDLKEQALKLWKSFNSHKSYIDEKVGRIENLENKQDNFMYIFSMFDPGRQKALMEELKESTAVSLVSRIVAGGGGVDISWLKYVQKMGTIKAASKGGVARRDKLSPERRREIAKKAGSTPKKLKTKKK